MRRALRTILREPLLHFLLLGAALFAVSEWRAGGTATGPRSIVVSRATIESLASAFARTWQRPPSGEELGGLVRDWVREEICAREAVALGLDRDDSVIRRRLRQKFEFVADDLAAQAEPTDAELATWLEAHAEEFRVERRLSFRQVALDPSRRGEGLERDALDLLALLRREGAAAPPAGLGDFSLLETELEDVPDDEVASRFGEEFAARLAALPLGEWQGPVASGYGAHLVLMTERTPGRVPALAEVREAVRRRWRDAKRDEAKERFHAELLKRYRVTIEPDPRASGGRDLAPDSSP